MRFMAGGIVWSRQLGDDVAPYLVIRVEYRDVHFMNLSTGQTFDIDVEMLDDRIQDTNDLRYEAPPCSG